MMTTQICTAPTLAPPNDAAPFVVVSGIEGTQLVGS